jgi:3-oxoacyl-[acyl-carrier protein] reductase
VQADLRERQGVAVIFRRHLERFGGLRILVNNAGDMVERVPTAETTEALWRSAIDLNLSSVFFACQEAIGPMSAQKRLSCLASVVSSFHDLTWTASPSLASALPRGGPCQSGV